MKLFLKFIKQYRYTALALVLFTIIFTILFFLYDIHMEAALYGGLLCALLGAGMAGAGFWKFKRRHLSLMNIYDNLPLMIENLPPPDNLTQEDLYSIIEKLDKIGSRNFTDMKRLHQDNIDYYTVWVHQIKTPIAAMQMILQSEDTEKNRELLAELFRIEQYVDMALWYLRVDDNSSDYVIKEYDLDGIIKKAVHRYAPQFIRKKIQLIYAPVKESVLTDEKWLLFIIEQLLSNAIKYTMKGSVSITCREGILTVSDTGIGIAAEDIPRIFEKGYTGLTGRNEKKSTGLGLYLCKKAADNLGHAISVKSVLGKGTAFSINLTTEKIDIE